MLRFKFPSIGNYCLTFPLAKSFSIRIFLEQPSRQGIASRHFPDARRGLDLARDLVRSYGAAAIRKRRTQKLAFF
jgi:hypothetical protein